VNEPPRTVVPPTRAIATTAPFSTSGVFFAGTTLGIVDWAAWTAWTGPAEVTSVVVNPANGIEKAAVTAAARERANTEIPPEDLKSTQGARTALNADANPGRLGESGLSVNRLTYRRRP
jgi:hypothetical protein